MNIHEYQAKQLFARYGVPVTQGEVATTPAQAEAAAARLGRISPGRGRVTGAVPRGPRAAADCAGS